MLHPAYTQLALFLPSVHVLSLYTTVLIE